NREYILKRTQETADLENEIADMEDILGNDNRVNKLIIEELRDISKKYGQPRRTMFLYDVEESAAVVEEPVKYGPVNIFLTREGYFKKIT
ncbi:MAG TPA: topoisomerase IV, partial [Ruminococcaceae bacterium]|nr:topoisomerase IV [Oscillospiraceae bacterium]